MAKKKRNVSMPAGIRNKLLAAVSMLMVSSIMLVSSTYAWFTLSTAPEVKNISTTVAGNGSLEIALMPTSGDISKISSGFSAEGGTVKLTDANVTWGNIVNLSDNYGLETINLNPARLNTTTVTDADNNSAASVDKEVPLSIVTYGYDGRIDQILANTSLMSYAGGAFSVADSYGVRAIGEIDGTNTLGSTYGYVVDLAFRLNTEQVGTDGTVQPGKLLLQTAATQRIYSDSDNADTLGGGSYMSFDATNTGIKDVKTLMNAVRITFVQNYGLNNDAVTPTVLGTAKLDVKNATTESGTSKTTAKVYLYDADGNKLENDNAELIPALTKNTAAQISAIVWLDGDIITNADVQAVVANDALAQATLNLQFGTDITLNPADNNVLNTRSTTTPSQSGTTE